MNDFKSKKVEMADIFKSSKLYLTRYSLFICPVREYEWVENLGIVKCSIPNQALPKGIVYSERVFLASHQMIFGL